MMIYLLAEITPRLAVVRPWLFFCIIFHQARRTCAGYVRETANLDGIT